MADDAILARLRHALQALALPADQQLLLLPAFVTEVDELALSFDHWLRIALKDTGLLLSRDRRKALAIVSRVGLNPCSRRGARRDCRGRRPSRRHRRSCALSGWCEDPR